MKKILAIWILAISLSGCATTQEIADKTTFYKGMTKENIKDKYEWFLPQHTPIKNEHAYYTFSCEYKSEILDGKSWKDFYNEFIRMGGDGFYASVVNPYLEPSIKHLFAKSFDKEVLVKVKLDF